MERYWKEFCKEIKESFFDVVTMFLIKMVSRDSSEKGDVGGSIGLRRGGSGKIGDWRGCICR